VYPISQGVALRWFIEGFQPYPEGYSETLRRTVEDKGATCHNTKAIPQR